VETEVTVTVLVAVTVPPTADVRVEVTVVKDGRNCVCVPETVEFSLSVQVVYVVDGVVTVVS
jgi:hypothetical protein